MDSCLNCFKLCRSKENVNQVQKTQSSQGNFLKSSFIPCFIRKLIKEEKLEDLPLTMEIPAVMMKLGIPVFKDLTELYLDSKVLSSDNMSQEVNNYVAPILQFVTSNGGDLILFENYLYHFLWNVEDRDFVSVLSHVVDLACYMQKHHLRSQNQMGLQMNGVIGISHGDVKVFIVGEPRKRILWCTFGNPIDESTAAVHHAEEGKVVIGPNAWKDIPKNKFDWNVRFLQDGFVEVSCNNPLTPPKPTYLKEIWDFMEYIENKFMDQIIACIHPLPIQANTVQQLEMLCSMSYVNVIAIYFPTIPMSSPEQLQKMVKVILEMLDNYEGLLTKIMFAQGVVIGIIFGYTGFKHNDDTIRALHFCDDVVKSIKSLDVFCIARITTGTCFNGIIGGPYRYECTVFGKPVYSTLNLIHHFHDIPIVCCINTVLRSQRELGGIFVQVKKRTRGLKSIPVCYEVNFAYKEPEWKVQCIGREREKEEITNCLIQLKENLQNLESKLPLILVMGPVGVGKTNFLKWIANEASHLGFQRKCNLQNASFEEPLERPWCIVRDLVHTDHHQYDSKFAEIFGDDVNKYPLYLFNKYFNTQFPSRKFPQESFQELQREMLMVLLKGYAEQDNLLIAMDEVERISMDTWLFIQDILITSTACVILGVTEPIKKFHSMPFVDYMLKQKFATIQLGQLEAKDIITLTCHFLDVVAIHKQLIRVIIHHSEGNPLRLQEILLLPQVQHHLCLVAYHSVVPSTLEQSFYRIEDSETEKDPSKMKVCDVLDPEGLKTVYIPKRLLDVVKEHTFGLTPEAQMLVKKCSCLGERFGLYILEAVCPEYTPQALRSSTLKLIQKNILAINCKHISMQDLGMRESVQISNIREEFCSHSLSFTSELLRECIQNFLPKGQKERLHLFIVSLLKETSISCDFCRKVPGFQILLAYQFFEKDCLIPRLNFFLCHCINFRLNIHSHIDYHLKECNAQVSRRIKFLLKAAELAMMSESEYEADTFLSNVEQIVDYDMCLPDENYFPILAKASIKRLDALTKFHQGSTIEAIDKITQALLLLGKVFPSDYMSGLPKPLKDQNIAFEKEETRCLNVGCSLLLNRGNFRIVYVISSYVLTKYLNFRNLTNSEDRFPTFSHVIQMQCMRFIGGCKTKSIRHMNKKMMEILQICNKKLDGSKTIDVVDLKAIIRTYTKIAFSLFELNELVRASVVGNRAFQIIKIVQGQKELAKVVSMLCLTYYYQKSATKCFEMLSQLQNSCQQTGDILSEALYHGIIVKALRKMDNPEIRLDKIRMCTEFVTTKDPKMLPTKHTSKNFWVSSLMALWCSEHHLEDAFKVWHTNALELKEKCEMINYWTISAALTMITINLNRAREQAYSYTSLQISALTEAVNKEVAEVEERVLQYAPVVRSKIGDTKSLIQTIWKENLNTTV